MIKNQSIALFSFPKERIQSYIIKIQKIPLITLEEEYELASNYRNKGDIEAAKKLVLSHLRFVVKIAKKYMGYGLNFGDLIQEGTIGLMKAVKNFNPDRGVRLVSFAIYWVKAEIHEFIIRNWRIVKIATTKQQRKLFFKLRSLKEKFSVEQKQLTSISHNTQIKEDVVKDMDIRLSMNDKSLESLNGSNSFSLESSLEDDSSNPATILEEENWQNVSQNLLHQEIEKLDERSRNILEARWLTKKKKTLKDLAKKFSLSPERIRQIEKLAMFRIKKILKEKLVN